MWALEDQLVFYGAYHSNGINKAIHVVCVPLILYSAMIMVSPWGLHGPVGLIYLLAYLAMDFKTGLLSSPLLLAITMAVPPFLGLFSRPILAAFALHAFSWAAQIVGHKVFEKRAPAFMDSLIPSLVLAPLFVWMELLFALGYKPDLRRLVENRVGKEIADFRKRRSSARS